MDHAGLSLPTAVRQSNFWLVSIQRLRIGQKQHVPDSLDHSLHLIKLFNSSYPEGNFGGNQLPDGSVGPSLLIQIIRTMCTQISPRTYARVPPDFVLFKQSSPAPGAYSCALCSSHSHGHRHWHTQTTNHALPVRLQKNTANTCKSVRIHRCCYKTGQTKPCNQKREPRIEKKKQGINCHMNITTSERSSIVNLQCMTPARKVSATYLKNQNKLI